MRRELEGDPLSGGLSLPRLVPGRSVLAIMDESVKRGLDILAAAGLLALLALPIAVIVVLIRIDSAGPGFYRCRRIGFRGREFMMLKFRKMHDDAEGPALTTKGDERFTRLGRFLANSKLDEVPQLWNVLKGQMSLVGPRPEDPEFVEGWADSYGTILEVRPGITGFSQIAFAKESEILDPEDSVGHYVSSILPQKVRLDQFYARRRSLLMDGRILIWTVAAVLLRRAVAVHRETGRLNVRRRRSRRSQPVGNLESGRRSPAGRKSIAVPPRTAANGNGSEPSPNTKTKAVVLAGGRGTRLAPYTSVLPKPLMPVGERAILELVVDQLEACGIKDITFCVGYLAHLIQSVFDNRENGHVSIEYVHEHEALGTAAPLRLVDGLHDTFLVMNGDVLTELDYRDLIRYHHEHGNMLTIATHWRSIKVDYGILHLDVTQRVRDFVEKPEITTPVSMGIYVMEPEVLEHIPEAEYFDFPHLVEALLDAGLPIGSYRFDGPWFDIGRQEDYEQAVSAWAAAEEAAEDDVSEHVAKSQSTNGNGHSIRSPGRSLGSFSETYSRPNGNGARLHSVDGGNGNGSGLGATLEWKKPDASAAGVVVDDFRDTLAGVPAPVTIVTTTSDQGPHGTTVNAFSSLSAEPPLVLVALDRSSDLLKLLPQTGRFAVNLLAGDQEELGVTCAKKGPEKFNKVPWHEDRGLPRIEGAAAWLACDIQEFLRGGDHVIVVGLVTACESEKDEALVYHRRRFLQLA